MLMERVAGELFQWIGDRFGGLDVHIHLFCGVGNNGGDGLALARLLRENGYDIQVQVVNFSANRSKGFLKNLERLKRRKLWPEILGQDSTFPELAPTDIVVDAIFGLGLNRAPEPWVGRLIEHINASASLVLSVDIPSGLSMDRAPWNPDHVVRAGVALSIQWPKMVFFHPRTGVYAKQWALLDIEMDREYSMLEESEYELIGTAEALPLYRPRGKFTHKGDHGHALIIGGSHGKIGAVQLAASAALATGSGMVTAHVPDCGYHSLQTAIPEVMVLTDREERLISKIELPFDPVAIGIGMGMGTDAKTVKAFAWLLKTTERPMVVDADGINILAAHRELLKELPPNSILTPHPKELERLIGPWKDDFEKLEKAKAFLMEHDVVLVLKGAHTITLSREHGYVNSSGNPGMATAGSGDVLAGMLTALLAQGYPPLAAAVLGVFLHGVAGDMDASENGFEAVRASGIVGWIGQAFVSLTMPRDDLEDEDWEDEPWEDDLEDDEIF